MEILNEAATTEKPYVIYALINESEAVFYVGKSHSLGERLKDHKMRFGIDFRCEVLQAAFGPEETPREAEKKWIEKYRAEGADLYNSVHNGRKPLRLKESRGGVNVRNVSLDAWHEFSKRVDEIGTYKWAAIDSAVLNWVLWTLSPEYASGQNKWASVEERIAQIKTARIAAGLDADEDGQESEGE